MRNDAKISWDHVQYYANSNISLRDIAINESWHNRIASKWSIKRIGVLQNKIEKHISQVYRGNRYGKVNLARLISGNVLIQFANESFGYNGWSSEIVEVTVMNYSLEEKTNGEEKEVYTVTAEAYLRLSLQDGTNTEASGVGKATLEGKGEACGKAKKEAIGNALKKCFLSFERLIVFYEQSIKKNYYADKIYDGYDSNNSAKERKA